MKGWAWICIISIILFVACGFWLLAFRPGDDIPSSTRESFRETPQAKLKDIHLVEMRGDQRMWEANADQVQIFEQRNITRISKMQRQIKLVLYQDENALTCYADEGEIDNQSKEVNLQGNLMAQSREGTTVWTDSVLWSPQSKKLSTDKQVTIKREGLIVQGLGMEADLALEEVKILSHITSSFDPSNAQFSPSRLGRNP